MIDIDGQFKYSKVIAITLADITGKLSVMPNPVVNETRVTFIPSESGKLSYKLIDNAGRIIMQNSIHVKKGDINTIILDMKNYSAGSYYLNVTGAGINNNMKLQKL